VNNGIAERGATFETVPRRIEDSADRVAEIERYPLLVASDSAGKVLGWIGLSS
jgi:L-amino acid N-acyltransferase YncA